jgi:hypothetical protein
VRSFRDLEVYQKALEGAVTVAKEFLPVLEKLKFPLRDEMVKTSLDIPRVIAEAHSARFESQARGIALLEEAMTACNKMVVYLEQVRGIYPEKIDLALVENAVKSYIVNRTKIFHLQKAWAKWQADARPAPI